MSEPRRPEDGSTEGSSPSWDQPSSTHPDQPGSGEPAPRSTEDTLVGTPTSEPTAVTSDPPAYEPVPSETTYQPAYTPPSPTPAAPSAPVYQQEPQPAYPPQYQQEQQPAYPPQYPQAAYPPAYQQPASAWGQSAVAPETRDHTHAHSLGVALASLFLGFWGLLFTLAGILFLVGGAGFADLIRNDAQLDGIDPAQLDQVMSVFGVGAVIMLLIGIPHLLAALGAPFHKGWARWLGVIVSILGILLGVLILSGGNSSTVVNDRVVTVSTIGPALFVIVPYALALLALILSRRHFQSG